MNGFFNLKIKDVVALSALTLVVFALITEYVFGQQGCFFCWVQRWLLLVFSICMYRCERKFFLVSAWIILLLGLALGLVQTHFLMSSMVSDACVVWGAGLPRVLFMWLLTFPACDYSGMLMIPWVVWLICYYSAIIGLLFRRKLNERAF